MSMICMYRALTADDVRRARADDEFLDTLLTQSIDAAYEIQIAEIRRHKQHPADRESVQTRKSAAAGTDKLLNIDKLWHGLHWLLCENAWSGPEPLTHAIIGGNDIGEDRGYGPARLVDTSMVTEVAAALGDLDHEALRRRFDPNAMAAAQLYPLQGRWADEPGIIDELLDAFDKLRTFFVAAAHCGDAVLIWLT